MRVVSARALQFACHTAACAPPPAGSGGSSPGLRRLGVPGSNVSKHTGEITQGGKVIGQGVPNGKGGTIYTIKSASGATIRLNSGVGQNRKALRRMLESNALRSSRK